MLNINIAYKCNNFNNTKTYANGIYSVILSGTATWYVSDKQHLHIWWQKAHTFSKRDILIRKCKISYIVYKLFYQN